MIKGDKIYILLSILFITIFTITTVWHPYVTGFDYWEHSSAVKEISRNPLNPTDTFTSLNIQSFRYNPYTIIMGAVFQIHKNRCIWFNENICHNQPDKFYNNILLFF